MYHVTVKVGGEPESLFSAPSASRAGNAIQDACAYAFKRAATFTLSSDYAAQQTDKAERTLTDALMAGRPESIQCGDLPITLTLQRT